MTAPSDVLRHEHRAIEHLLEAMDGMAAALDRGERVPRAEVDKALDVASGFADACHHAKEEKVLFPALRGTPEGDAVVHALEGDHKAARNLIATLRAEAARGEGADVALRQRVARDARLYTKVLRAHIRDEDARLLPLAERLPPRKQHQLAAAFERVEREETGAGAHERFERAIHDLHARWAKAD